MGKVIDCVSKINTGGKYDSGAFQKSVGLNGVGTKAANALSSYFKVQSFREGKTKWAEFRQGELMAESSNGADSNGRNGTHVVFEPDNTIFKNYHYIPQFLDYLIWNYAYLNAGLTVNFNGQKYYSQKGLFDLLSKYSAEDERRYPIIHLKGNDIEMALTHGNQYGEEYYSFVNGQNTTQGGTHLQGFREALVKTFREFYKKDYAPEDIRASIVGAIAVRVQEPVFESQTKTKLGSNTVSPDPNSQSVKSFIADFIKKYPKPMACDELAQAALTVKLIPLNLKIVAKFMVTVEFMD